MQKNKCIAYSGVQVQFTLLCTQIRWGELWRILLKIHNKINTPPQNSTEKIPTQFPPPCIRFAWTVMMYPPPPLVPISTGSHSSSLLVPAPPPAPRACQILSAHTRVGHTHMGNVCGMKCEHKHTHTDTYSEAYLTVDWPQTDALHLIVAAHFEIVELSPQL